MKYSRIEKDELEKLEKEFVDFLVVNGITAEDWLAIKENEPLNADEIINQFSDVVWESILRSTKYLMKVEENAAYYFYCGEDNIQLIRVIKKEGGRAEKQMLDKSYAKTRELEIFEMISNGCVICEGEEYNQLKS